MRYYTALTIAGSDSCGGAGIQADIKTMSALGVYAASAITAITVQNTKGVYGIQNVEPEIVKGQIEAVMEDIHPDAIKIGMVMTAIPFVPSQKPSRSTRKASSISLLTQSWYLPAAAD